MWKLYREVFLSLSVPANNNFTAITKLFKITEKSELGYVHSEYKRAKIAIANVT